MALTITQNQLLDFSKKVLIASGADPKEAAIVAKILVWSDLIGRENQGVWRLPILCQRVSQKLVSSPCDYMIEKVSSSAVLIDGKQGMGHYLAYEGMEKAIDIAKETGIAFVGIRDSNFFGAGAYYIEQAASAGMIGIAASNSFPKVAAYQGVSSVLGTNPFAFSAPRENGHNLLLDMSTSASAGSSIRKAIEKNEQLPKGIAVDSTGKDIRNPADVDKGTILPFGGAKGYGLSLMVEILSGIITGAGYSHGVKSMYKNIHESGNNGHFFIAIDISKLMPLAMYYERMESFIKMLQGSGINENSGLDDKNEQSEDTNKVLLPGELRWETYEKNLKQGLVINTETTTELKKLADQYRIDFSLYS
ncbi:MAG: Ldh family oxidoreductase [Cocleimonas sp.]